MFITDRRYQRVSHRKEGAKMSQILINIYVVYVINVILALQAAKVRVILTGVPNDCFL